MHVWALSKTQQRAFQQRLLQMAHSEDRADNYSENRREVNSEDGSTTFSVDRGTLLRKETSGYFYKMTGGQKGRTRAKRSWIGNLWQDAETAGTYFLFFVAILLAMHREISRRERRFNDDQVQQGDLIVCRFCALSLSTSKQLETVPYILLSSFSL